MRTDVVTNVEAWRSELAEGAAIWSGRGCHGPDHGRWLALSGLPSTDANVIFCFGGDQPDAIRRSVKDACRSSVPIVIMIADGALGWAQVLVDGGLVCVGASPFMRLPGERIETGVTDPAVRRLRHEDLPDGRAVVAAAYPAESPMAQIALPDEGVGSPVWGLWGLEEAGALVSVVTTARVGAAVGIWSMATPARHRRHGYGRRLLRAVVSAEAEAGVDHVLLYASPSGEPLYRAMGFEVVEHWQQWSRPRWLLGRT